MREYYQFCVSSEQLHGVLPGPSRDISVFYSKKILECSKACALAEEKTNYYDFYHLWATTFFLLKNELYFQRSIFLVLYGFCTKLLMVD